MRILKVAQLALQLVKHAYRDSCGLRWWRRSHKVVFLLLRQPFVSFRSDPAQLRTGLGVQPMQAPAFANPDLAKRL
jgi:hypothetical protein